jgi:hypothetical protein
VHPIGLAGSREGVYCGSGPAPGAVARLAGAGTVAEAARTAGADMLDLSGIGFFMLSLFGRRSARSPASR